MWSECNRIRVNAHLGKPYCQVADSLTKIGSEAIDGSSVPRPIECWCWDIVSSLLMTTGTVDTQGHSVAEGKGHLRSVS